jgi:hypothetical protein
MNKSTSSHMPVKPTSSNKSSTLLFRLSLPKCSGTNGVRIFKDSGNTPELAYRALLDDLLSHSPAAAMVRTPGRWRSLPIARLSWYRAMLSNLRRQQSKYWRPYPWLGITSCPVLNCRVDNVLTSRSSLVASIKAYKST